MICPYHIPNRGFLRACEFAMSALSRLFPDCQITPIQDQDHFLFYYRFLNANLQTTEVNPLDLSDSGYSIQQNCLRREFLKLATG